MSSLIKSVVATVNAQNVAATLAGLPSPGKAAFQLVGAFSGTITFEASVDGTTFAALPVTPIAGGATVTTATAAGIWYVDTQGFAVVRARCSAYTSGTPALSARYGAL